MNRARKVDGLCRSGRGLLAALPALVLFTLPHPAAAMKMQMEVLTCPIGGETFRTMTTVSGYRAGIRLDGRAFGRIASPDPLPQCPGNGFVLYQDEFTAEEIAKLEPVVRDAKYQTLRKRHRTYYLGAYLLEQTGTPIADLSGYYLRASWQAEGGWSPSGSEKPSAADRKLIEEYRAASLRSLDTALMQKDIDAKSWWSKTILAAELERLLGRFDRTRKRLAASPPANAEPTPGQKQAIAQILGFAGKKDSAPRAFKQPDRD